MPNIYLANKANPGFFLHTCNLTQRDRPGALHDGFSGLNIISDMDGSFDSVLLPISSYKPGVLLRVISSLPAVIHDQLKSGSARLVIDYSHEAGSMNMARELTECLTQFDIRSCKSCAMIVQNRLVKSDDHRLHIFYYDAFIVAASLAVARSINERLQDPLCEQAMSRFQEPRILCLNATPRRHRILTLLMLEENGLISFSGQHSSPKSGVFSFPGLEYVKKGVEIKELLGWIHDSAYGRLLNSLPRLLCNSPFVADSTCKSGNSLATEIALDLYLETALSVVTETSTDLDVLRVTEKTFKAAAMGHPFVVIGNPHSIELTRGFGFQAFDDILDHSYDSIADVFSRVDMAVDEAFSFVEGLKQGNLDYSLLAEYSEFNLRWNQGAFLDWYHRNHSLPIVEYMRTGALL